MTEYEQIVRAIRYGHDMSVDCIADRVIAAGCESPIERQLLAALLAVQRDEVTVHLMPSMALQQLKEFAKAHQNTSALTTTAYVAAQVQVGKRRVDLCVAVWEKVSSEPLLVAVECDGHAFHEKTKEQAAADKARGRELVEAGLRVLHFTGSEIWQHPGRCAEQVLDLVSGWAMESWISSVPGLRELAGKI